MLSTYLRLRASLARQRGQGLVEYALILVLVAIVVIGVLSTMGGRIQAAFQDIVSSLGG
jgi:pilus assembly protein Flp/PilA